MQIHSLHDFLSHIFLAHDSARRLSACAQFYFWKWSQLTCHWAAHVVMDGFGLPLSVDLLNETKKYIIVYLSVIHMLGCISFFMSFCALK